VSKSNRGVASLGILKQLRRFRTAPATAEPIPERRSDERSNNRVHLVKNGAEAHALTREDRAKGGRARAEKLRKRKELRERLQVNELEDLAEPEPQREVAGDYTAVTVPVAVK